MLKTSIEKPTYLQTRSDENNVSSVSCISGRAKLVVVKNANLVKSKFQNLDNSKNSIKTNNKSGNLGFLTLEAKKTFTKLRQVFTKVLMLTHFESNCYIQIETYIFGYVIEKVLSQLILETNNWHLLANFLEK